MDDRTEPEPDAVLRLLSVAWGRLGGVPAGRVPLVAARTLGRAWARASILRRVNALPDDITVLIGVRNRSDHRIVNALASVRDQAYPWGKITTLVIDYGSDEADAHQLRDLCSRVGAELLRVENAGAWSRGRCLNVGLRHVTTKYLLTSDADLILSPHYLADAVATVRAHPLSIACSEMLDLPEESVDVTRRSAGGGHALDIAEWKSRCTPRLGWALHPSIAVTFTAFHHAIRGYDEFYEGWGREDDDLMRRFKALGLNPTAVPKRSYYLHQWHPKFEGFADEERAHHIDRNNAYFYEARSILRNDEDWGRR